MKTVAEVREMLKEARTKFAGVNKQIEDFDYFDSNEVEWGGLMSERSIAEAEIRCFMAVLGSDEIDKGGE